MMVKGAELSTREYGACLREYKLMRTLGIALRNRKIIISSPALELGQAAHK